MSDPVEMPPPTTRPRPAPTLTGGVAQLTFFWGGDEDLQTLTGLDPDQDWREFICGERIWTLQTYLRLVDAGFPATLSSSVPDKGLVVYHSNHSRRLRREYRLLGDAWLVVLRGDKTRPLRGDYQVTQNGFQSSGWRSTPIPSWPQPGLIPRDPQRGDRVRRIAYKGYENNLDEAFRSLEWRDYLSGRGVEWVDDSVPFRGPHSDSRSIRWHDYHDIDAILAVRPQPLRSQRSKPAAKLCNAWAAGVPAIVGSEHAFREIRRSEADFLEANTPAEARRAVDRLIDEPGLYRAMALNSKRRAEEFGVESVLAKWVDLLYCDLGHRVAVNGARHGRGALRNALPLLR